jgi:hypothetical protein
VRGLPRHTDEVGLQFEHQRIGLCRRSLEMMVGELNPDSARQHGAPARHGLNYIRLVVVVS